VMSGSQRGRLRCLSVRSAADGRGVRLFFTEKGMNPSRFFYEKFSATEAVTA
jgi:hypothetical protein